MGLLSLNSSNTTSLHSVGTAAQASNRIIRSRTSRRLHGSPADRIFAIVDLKRPTIWCHALWNWLFPGTTPGHFKLMPQTSEHLEDGKIVWFRGYQLASNAYACEREGFIESMSSDEASSKSLGSRLTYASNDELPIFLYNIVIFWQIKEA